MSKTIEHPPIREIPYERKAETGSRTALLLVMLEVEPDAEEEFNLWYELEHLPERIGMPGFRSSKRYVAIDTRETGKVWHDKCPKYLTLYEMLDASALDTPQYQTVMGENISAWTAKMLPKIKIMARNVYQEIQSDADYQLKKSV